MEAPRSTPQPAAKHAPLPWGSVAARPGLEPDIAITSGAKILAEVFVRIHGADTFSPEERDANAALIVRAVNAHEALVEALRSAIYGLDRDGPSSACATLNMLGRAALALAEGK